MGTPKSQGALVSRKTSETRVQSNESSVASMDDDEPAPCIRSLSRSVCDLADEPLACSVASGASVGTASRGPSAEASPPPSQIASPASPPPVAAAVEEDVDVKATKVKAKSKRERKARNVMDPVRAASRSKSKPRKKKKRKA